MQKFTQLSITLDDIQIKTAHQMLDTLLEKIKVYNEEIKKSNRLLRDQEALRNRLGITVKHGKAQGLVEQPVKTKDKK